MYHRGGWHHDLVGVGTAVWAGGKHERDDTVSDGESAVLVGTEFVDHPGGVHPRHERWAPVAQPPGLPAA